MIDFIIYLLVFCVFILSFYNYIMHKYFIDKKRIKVIEEVSDLNYSVILFFDSVACVNCIPIFRSLESEIKYPVFFMEISNKYLFINTRDLVISPSVIVLEKGVIIGKLTSFTENSAFSVNEYSSFINDTIDKRRD